MTEQELHPLPPDTLITEDMVAKVMSEGEMNRDVAIGLLLDWHEGRGTMPDSFASLWPELAHRHTTLRETKEVIDKEKEAADENE